MHSRIQIIIRGAVQGVGFRPFIFNLAQSLDLRGFVNNSADGVTIEAEGEKEILDLFLLKIEGEKPAISRITGLEYSVLDPAGFKNFEIRRSPESKSKTALILPDIGVCDDCIRELNDPRDRRYLYPFINCTNCGPRFSIIESITYDRPNTSMKEFVMCENCREEYENPLDRRFHAQPIACPDCGPQLELWDNSGKIIASGNDALQLCINQIDKGNIIALKGIGGFQLVCESGNDETITKLRERKHREEKPFAVMFPDIESLEELCDVTGLEIRTLKSPEAPILLLKRKVIDIPASRNKIISDLIAPDNPCLGVMLPYSPLHYLILHGINNPLVATSGNLSEEPICIENEEALEKLKGIADYFLTHNRPIVRHVDDSIVKIIYGREMVLRRARGFAPFPIAMESDSIPPGEKEPLLAVGGFLKNSIALKIEKNIFVSQHIGDLSTDSAFSAFKKVINDFQILYDTEPKRVICDKHPAYNSTVYAQTNYSEVKTVQHHYAHIASCRAENQVHGETLGVSWDGTGYGNDATVWGGEFFISGNSYFSHAGQFRKFKLPGGEKAIKEGRRAALGIVYEIYQENFNYNNFFKNIFSSEELLITLDMLKKNINSPFTSSAGRLFDAVAALTGISTISNFEGQSAMKLEYAADEDESASYNFNVKLDKIYRVNWGEMILSILDDIKNNISSRIISRKFHNTLSKIILVFAQIMNKEKVILSGGCFQNQILLSQTINLLQKSGFRVYWNQRIPPNDGGISLGQIAAAYSVEVPFESGYE